MKTREFRKAPAILAAAGLALVLVLTGCLTGGDGRPVLTHDDGIPPTVMTVSTGLTHTVAIKTDGSLWTWGQNLYGRTGIGVGGGNMTTPLQIGRDNDWAYVAAGAAHTVAIGRDGSLWAWGSNSHGQLGDGTIVNRWAPTRIGTDTNWAYITAGLGYTVAIRTDGTLWAWGNNEYGQLGIGETAGTTPNRLTPTQIGTDTNWAYVAAGIRHHTAAIRTDGSLWAWGRKDRYSGWPPVIHQVIQDYGNAPVQIGTDTNWAYVAVGGSYIMAIQTDGSLWAWGRNCMGQLGIGEAGAATYRLTPTRVGTGANWVSVAAGGSHTLAIQTDGSLWAWGANWSGQLGVGGATGPSINWDDSYGYEVLLTPTRIGVDADWASVVVGGSHTLATRTDGTLWAWGGNWFGHLGDGTTTDRNSPVNVIP